MEHKCLIGIVEENRFEYFWTYVKHKEQVQLCNIPKPHFQSNQFVKIISWKELLSISLFLFIYSIQNISERKIKFHRLFASIVVVVGKNLCQSILYQLVFFCHSLLFWHNDGNNNNIIFLYGLLANIRDSIKIQWMFENVCCSVIGFGVLLLVSYGKNFTLLFLCCCLSFLHGLQLKFFGPEICFSLYFF